MKRNLFKVAFLILPAATYISCVAKKSKAPTSTVQDASDPAYAKAAEVLQLLGARITDTTYSNPQANRCAGSCHQHGTSNVLESNIKKWAESAHDLFKCLRSSTEAVTQEKCLRDPLNPSRYSTKTLGLARGGVGTQYFVDLFKRRYPDESEFKKKYMEFVTSIQMPEFKFDSTNNPNKEVSKVVYAPPYFGQDGYIDNPHALPFTDDQFKMVMDWFLGEGAFQGNPMAYRSDLMNIKINPDEMPQACVENISDELISHVKNMNSFGWTRTHLIKRRTTMMGCETAPDIEDASESDDFDINLWAKSCLKNFKKVEEFDFAKTWGKSYIPGTNGFFLPQTLRMLKELPYQSTYWMRSSADGRYIGNGLRGGNGVEPPPGANGFVVDLGEKTYDRIIHLDGPYDPGFFPDNQGVTWMSGGGVFCNQDALSRENLKDNGPEDKAFLHLSGTNRDKHCTPKSSMGVYQHVGAQLDNNVGNASYFTVRGDSYANDDTGTGFTSDPSPENFAGQDSVMEIYKMHSTPLVNGESLGFEIADPIYVTTPFEGDYGISPSGQIVTTRLATATNENGPEQLGYRFSKIYVDKMGEGTSASKENLQHKKVIGEICMKGGKASMSFNERFIVTHHVPVNNDEDRVDLGYAPEGQPADPNFPRHTYENFTKVVGNSANIYLYDILTKRQYRLTSMEAGQWAAYPHFRADGWLYFLVRDRNLRKDFAVASDAAIIIQSIPIPGNAE